MGISASGLVGGDYLKSDFLKSNGPVRGVISNVGIAEFNNPKTGGKDRKLEITIDLGNEEKKVTLNKTSVNVLIAAYGDDTDGWLSRPVVVFHDPNVTYGGRAVGGIRVKVPAQRAAKPAAAPAPVAAPVSDAAEPVEVPEDDIPF